MHEAGLATAVVGAIREHGLAGRHVRVVVTGGHDDPGAFDESLRFHLQLSGPELDLSRIEIVHLPSDRWCPSCGHRFAAVGDADCPSCGRATMAERTEERVELETVDDEGPAEAATGDDDGRSDRHLDPGHDHPPYGSSDPGEGDARPSAPPGHRSQA